MSKVQAALLVSTPSRYVYRQPTLEHEKGQALSESLEQLLLVLDQELGDRKAKRLETAIEAARVAVASWKRT